MCKRFVRADWNLCRWNRKGHLLMWWWMCEWLVLTHVREHSYTKISLRMLIRLREVKYRSYREGCLLAGQRSSHLARHWIETWYLYSQRLQWDLKLATKRRKRLQEIADSLECPDLSLPDGQPFVQLAWPIADIVQKLHLQRHGICYPTSLASPRVYLRCVAFGFYSELKP